MFENESNRQVELSDQMWTSREKMMIRNLPESSLVRILGETGRAAASQVNGNEQQQQHQQQKHQLVLEESKHVEFEENLRKVRLILVFIFSELFYSFRVSNSFILFYFILDRDNTGVSFA